MTVYRHQTWALILAAGSGNRLASAIEGRAKQFLPWHGKPLYWHSALAMRQSCLIDGLVFVFPSVHVEKEKKTLLDLVHEHDLTLPWQVVEGGASRQDSVRHGLEALPPSARYVLIHDAARPFVTAGLVRRVCQALTHGAIAVIPGLPVTDTIKMTEDDIVKETLPRDRLTAVQTPQGFELTSLRQAHADAQKKGLVVTDDAALLEIGGVAVHIIKGDATNVKITNPEDLALLHEPVLPRPCTGMGYDVHRFGTGRPLKLGGVPIPSDLEIVAHSDGDVLLHALMDAMLGCAGLGDIGQHFPDDDATYAGISSAVLLDQVLDMLSSAHIRISHVDMTIVAQCPRLAPYREDIRKNVARLLHLDKSRVNLKATTEEKMGFTGRAEGIKAYAVVSALCHDVSPSSTF